jgi:hypothetical protein
MVTFLFEQYRYDFKNAMNNLKIKKVKEIVNLEEKIKAQDKIIKNLYQKLKLPKQIGSINIPPELIQLLAMLPKLY